MMIGKAISYLQSECTLRRENENYQAGSLFRREEHSVNLEVNSNSPTRPSWQRDRDGGTTENWGAEFWSAAQLTSRQFPARQNSITHAFFLRPGFPRRCLILSGLPQP
jgi:hypothetical protein